MMKRKFTMPKKFTRKTPLISREECFALLPGYSINAMNLLKRGNHNPYYEEIESLSKIFVALITHYSEPIESIINCMEKAMYDAYKEELDKIEHEIQRLFKIRKNTPIHSLFGEREIEKLTIQISELEKCKSVSVKEIIQGVIYDTLDKASQTLVDRIPGNYKLQEYESRGNPFQ
ncbi:TPA: hypothetical protein JBD00_13565 [Legionella pneumophila subsp. pneumophila]|nr:hypothetical protein [Legionella pneumophila]HAT8880050.1 hypothetical protein [Legionella pneumophila subsp. pneumophila]HAT6338409.1 hypothetical protein [Legionella pneumophila]HAT6372276.1 hypothetical protein [Legionella pneumophila]HAT6375354.1 hypothetical protein [Legionella pneumophila]